MSKSLGIGIIGCGDISQAYMKLIPIFHHIELRACADKDHSLAQSRATQFGIRANSVADILAATDIDIIVNLTNPSAHFEVSKSILQAGKHVYSEKPFVLSLNQGTVLAKLAAENKRRIGSAPDTFLGGAHQHCRHLIDNGAIGKVTSGTAHVMGIGMEHWHPDPQFFYQPGAGPVLDMGPYYITNLVQLIGPVKRVCAMSSIPSLQRTITSKLKYGQKINVETPTTIHAVLEFQNSAIITFGASWDVWNNGHHNIELYGEKGTLFVPDPNYFGGLPSLTRGYEPVKNADSFSHPFSVPNEKYGDRELANYRACGLAEMASAIINRRAHLCSLDLSLHVIDILTSILKAAEVGKTLEIFTTCQRPGPLSAKGAAALLR